MSLQKGKQQGTASEIISLSLKNPTQVYRDDAGRYYLSGEMFKSKGELEMFLRLLKSPLLLKIDKFFTRVGNLFSRKQKQ